MKSKFATCFAAMFTLLVFAISGIAKEIKGGPDRLIGTFGRNPEECRSFNRKSDAMLTFTKDAMTACGGSGCEAQILSHVRTSDGFVLKFVSRGNPKGWSTRFKLLDESTIESDGETHVRCTERDIRAGIGLQPGGQGKTQSLGVAFSAYYALEIPNRCASLRSNKARAEAIIKAAELAWAEYIAKLGAQTFGKTYQQYAASTIKDQQANASYAVRADADEIRDFCVEVLNAFGKGGSVIPDLLNDPRKGA